MTGAVGCAAAGGAWILGASASQLNWLSNHLLRLGGLGLLFVVGVAVGVLLVARSRGDWGDARGGGGDGGTGEPEPWIPPADDIDAELQRIIDEERNPTAPRPGGDAPRQ